MNDKGFSIAMVAFAIVAAAAIIGGSIQKSFKIASLEAELFYTKANNERYHYEKICSISKVENSEICDIVMNGSYTEWYRYYKKTYDGPTGYLP